MQKFKELFNLFIENKINFEEFCPAQINSVLNTDVPINKIDEVVDGYVVYEENFTLQY